jgi:hypothetical protein
LRRSTYGGATVLGKNADQYLWMASADCNPDLIAFQEAIVGGGYDQLKDILGAGHHVAHQSLGLVGDGNHGASIASRWPIREVREANLYLTPRTGDYPCGTLAAEILAPEPLGPLLFACHGPSHQLSYEYERELQAVAAARLVEELVELVGAPCSGGRRLQRGPRRPQRGVLARRTFTRGHERVLLGRLGEGAARGSGTHVHDAQPAGIGEQAGFWAGAQDRLPSLGLRGLPVRPHA